MTLDERLLHVKQLITQTEIACHRKPGSVLLLAVSKQQSVAQINQAFSLGISHFGENYYQEALKKIKTLQYLPIVWHFIGSIQRNKTKGIASHFSWVHSLDNLQTATRLNQYRSVHREPLNVCLQINLDNEQSKSGISPKEATALAAEISSLPHLKLRGLMTIPSPTPDEKKQFELFLQLNQLLKTLNNELNVNMDTLSMGMSADLVPAIRAGATIVRVGHAIFGHRKGKKHEH